MSSLEAQRSGVEESGAEKGINLTPRQIVAELNRFVIAQDEAKRAVAIALRNRWRRLQAAPELREEITPKNIIMIGPTGVGKTEIARRLAKLSHAPFVKVEASKFTEVGYVGRDVESIIRDLAEVSYSLVKKEEQERLKRKAEVLAEEKLLDLLLPESKVKATEQVENSEELLESELSEAKEAKGSSATREKLRAMLREGKLDERIVEIETQKQVHTHLEIMGPPGFAEVEGQIKDMLSSLVPKPKEKRKLNVKEAMQILRDEAAESLVEPEKIAQLAVKRAEQSGIVFIDEIDKICSSAKSSKGPDVSREGVQRDLLPIVEGSTVSTKHGPIRTDHVLFIASGAFHHSKPSDLMPEFQGRFPIRVELKSLTAEHFARILKEPKNALTRQYQALLQAENVNLEFSEEAIVEISRLTAEVNSKMEDIGARRLHTLLERLLEDVSFEADERCGETVKIDLAYVQEKLRGVIQDLDLARFIL